jgi:polyisoprenoid-binding protein YceI
MKTFNSRLLICAVALIAGTSAHAGEIYQFDQTHSKISFGVHHLLGNANGEFHRFSGTIDLNRDAPEHSTVSARIEVASIDTGIVKRDNHLRSPDFFDTRKYPEITFKGQNVKRTGDRSADVTGNLSMHGVTRPIVLHVQLLDSVANDRSRWKVTTAPLKRRDFGLLFGGTAEAVSGIGQEVSINIEIESTRAR